ncbi:MAG TPA: UbiA family prenyltransferase, partial [Chthoniobacteraceae bacterium]
MTSPPPSRFRTWLQLFRAPNLFTVPGDPLAGYLFANNGFVDLSLALVIGASLAFYMAGLLMNDLADEAEDRRERPNRPLPSGAASRSAVIAAMLGLFTLGLFLLLRTHSGGAVYCGIAVICAITLYNFATKHWPFIGAVNMGLCRGLSVLLGGFAGPLAIHGMAIFPMLAIGIYIAVVTNLAR